MSTDSIWDRLFSGAFAAPQDTSGAPEWLITGLGNPGEKYHGTRHNAGFLAADELIDAYSYPAPDTNKRFKGMLGRGSIEGIPAFILKPTTYMNLSGESIRAVADYYHIDVKTHLIVLVDEVHLPMGKIRVRKKGSAGGHNGLKSIIARLGTEEFTRIRIGVGESSEEDLVGHVLGRPAPADRENFEKGIAEAAKAAVWVLKEGADSAMNKFNGGGMQ